MGYQFTNANGAPHVYHFNKASGKMILLKVAGVSEKQTTRLSEIEKTFPDLCYAIKNGEARVEPRHLKVDGFSLATNTVLEFDRCYYHRCTSQNPAI